MPKKKKVSENPKMKVLADWKSMDLAEVVRKDLAAAVAFLRVIEENPILLRALIDAMEKWRTTMIERESKNPDRPFAGETQPAA